MTKSLSHIFEEQQSEENLLLEQDLRSTLAEHSVAAVVVLQYCTHGLSHRVKGVDLKQLLLWYFIADVLVVSPKVEAKSQ